MRARARARTHARTYVSTLIHARTHACHCGLLAGFSRVPCLRALIAVCARAGLFALMCVRALVQVCTELRALYPESLPIIMVRPIPADSDRRLGPSTRIADSDCRLGSPTRIATRIADSDRGLGSRVPAWRRQSRPAATEHVAPAEKGSAALTPESEPAEQTRFAAV